MSNANVAVVTGGAGYIGSHMTLALRDAGWAVVVIDNLSTGRRQAVPADVPLVEGDIGDAGLVADVLARHRPAAVVDLARSVRLPEAVVERVKHDTVVPATVPRVPCRTTSC